MKHINKFTLAAVGLLAGIAASPVMADDSEVFTNSSFTAGVQPNVLFIIDTSGSMDTTVNVYDPTVTYTGPCPAGRVYWQTASSSTPPVCTTTQWVSEVNNRCRAAGVGMGANGWWRGRTQMLITGSNPSFWGNAQAGKDLKLECQTDHGNHGDDAGTVAASSANRYARNGTGTAVSGRWGNSTSGNQLVWGGLQQLSLYSSNYANWWYGVPGDPTPRSRLDIVKAAANTLIDNLDGVNLGIMRYSTDAQGGMVRYPVSALTAANRAALKTEVNSYAASGNTPLSETMYEAHQYLSGGTIVYGAVSSPQHSIASSRTGGLASATTYDSPMDFSCQNTYVVYLTDGLPTGDNAADTAIEALPGFDTDGGGACPARIPDPDPSHLTSGRCLQNLTRYMHNHDLRPSNNGKQTVTTYFIGFGAEIAASATWLQDVAAAGGGSSYTASDAAGLASTLEEIFSQVTAAADTTFVSPAVSVNAFNRTQNLNDLFVSVFEPSKNFHWAGNLKKYRIVDREIRGVDLTTSAVDPDTGFFREGAKALNTPTSDDPDGPKARLGGSAARLPDWAAGERNLYTYLGASTSLTNPTNGVEVSNATLTRAMVGATTTSARQQYIDFARGRDLTDEDGDTNKDENRKRMGDPMHARPAIVIYSGTAAAPVGTVFTPTNDGYLHAFDMSTGDELWAFIPPDYLSRIAQLYGNAPVSARDYSLDGDMRVFKYDLDQDGIVEPADGDKVYLFFGTRRGGSIYYSLDVTERESPKWRWKKSNVDLPKLGKAWSTPEIARVNIQGATQNAQKLVLIFGGGYDVSQDANAYTTDSVGNAIFMLDLETGALLWSASNTGADLNNASMTHSIPSGITVMDTDADHFADRMYAADMGGRIWRFDIWNGEPVGTLVTGGVFASLGGAASGGAPAQNRRFYGSPDVAPISTRGSRPFFNIAIGSGYRGHPLEYQTEDRFYAIRDYKPFTKRTAASYAAAAPVLDSDLINATNTVSPMIADGSYGWKLELNLDGWRGEKVLGESTTAAGVTFFTTFTPLAPDPDQPCLARTLNRVYAVYATNARPFTRWDSPLPGDPTDPTDPGPEDWDPRDRFDDLTQSGIAPPPQILPDEICQVGATILNRCVKFGTAIRSYWEHR